MQQLWSPWRSAYIQSADERHAEGCFLCACAAAAEDTPDNLVVARFPSTIVVMNRFPYNAGHLLVAPKEHHGDLATLGTDQAHELIRVVQTSLRVIDHVMRPHGCNVGANLGRGAGAGVPDHLHIHAVPRWNGDTNFMPVLADVKVVSDDLVGQWQRFHDAFAESHGEA